MRLSNIVHLTREHHFNITLVPSHTDHYILTNTGIGATIINVMVRNKFNRVLLGLHTQLYFITKI